MPVENPRAITVVAQKGGQGKTTCAKNITAELSERGHRTLLIDLDDNAHLSRNLGYKSHYEMDTHLGDIILEGRDGKPSDIFSKTEWGFDFVPAHTDYKTLNTELKEEMQPSVALKNNLIDPLLGEYYDYIIMDTGPNQSMLTNNSLVASQNMAIPLSVEDGAEGLHQTLYELYIKLPSQMRNILTVFPTKLSANIQVMKNDRKLVEGLNSGSFVEDEFPHIAEELDEPLNLAEKVPNFARISPDEFEAMDEGEMPIEGQFDGKSPKPGIRINGDIGADLPLPAVNPDSPHRKHFQELADIVEAGEVVHDDAVRGEMML